MSSVSQKDRIKQSWQPRRLQGAPAWVWLFVRRVTATLIAAALLGGCIYLLVTLASAHRTYFVYLAAGAYDPLGGQPVSYAYGDFSVFQQLDLPLTELDSVDPSKSPLTKKVLEERLSGLASWGMRSKDTLIVYLTAHGVVHDKQAYLLCEKPGEGEPDEGKFESDFVPISLVLEALQEAPAGAKLLILDAGRASSDPRLGTMINTFPKLLNDAVQQTGDRNLWVLSANDSFEPSHVSPALEKSVIGYVLSKGLDGAADSNHDRQIALDELVQYVRTGVSTQVKAVSTNESQTPLLMHCDPEELAATPVLLFSRLPAPATGPEVVHEEGEEAPARWWQFWKWRAVASAKKDVLKMAPEAVVERLENLTEEEGAEEGGEKEEGAEGEESHSENPAAVEGHAASDSPGVAENRGESSARSGAGGIDQDLKTAWEETARIEDSADWPAPSVFAPAVWRELKGRLLWYEEFCNVGLPSKNEAWQPVLRDLRDINESLKAYSKNRVPRPSRNTAIDTMFDRIRTSFPHPTFKLPKQYVSLALIEQIGASDPSQPLPSGMKAFVAEYDALLAPADAATSASDLKELLDKQKEDLHLGNFYEFQLLDLRTDTDVSWELLRLVLHARRTGEQAAANLLCGEGWARPTIDAADRLRWEGERLILDRTDGDWRKRSKDRLEAAEEKYDEAVKETDLVRRAIEQRNQLLGRVPDYVRWAHRSRGDSGSDVSEDQALTNLFSLLNSTDAALSSPSDKSLSRSLPSDKSLSLDDCCRQLQDARADFDTRLAAVQNSWRMADLLATALPPPELREKLQAALPKAERRALSEASQHQESVAEPPLPTESVADARWKEIGTQLDLELALARLAGFDEEKIKELEQTREASESERWDKLIEANDKLRDLYGSLPKAVESIVALSDLDLADQQIRRDRLVDLRNTTHQWLLLGAQSGDELARKKINLISILNQAAWYDLLRWQSQRFQQAAVDVPAREYEFLRNAADECRELANSIPGQPKIDEIAQPQLSFEAGAPQIHLDQDKERELKFKVTSDSKTKMPIWIVAQYNSRLLAVEGRGVYSQDNHKPAELIQRVVASANLPAGGTQEFKLNIQRLTNEAETTKFILKAVSGNICVRRELEVTLPTREQLQLTVAQGRDFWTLTSDGVILHPLPNSNQDFAFQIANRTEVAKKIAVSFLVPVSMPASGDPLILPSGPQELQSAKKLVEHFGPVNALVRELPIELPASNQPVDIRLSATDPRANEANLLPADPTAPDQSPKVPLRHGILVWLKDEQSQKVTLRRIEIAPQRPRGFLKAVAHYQQDTRRLQIDVEATNPRVLPPDGIEVSLEVQSVSSLQDRSDKADLTAGSPSASLYAYLSSNAPQEVTASVDVGNVVGQLGRYPRAFVFQIHSAGPSRDIEPESDYWRVQIVKPGRQGQSYAARRLKAIPVTVEVDAADGAFDDSVSTSYVEVGIDGNRDGDLGDRQYDRSVRLPSDRQVTVDAVGFSPDGKLRLDTRVDDFVDLLVPTNGLSDITANLLGRIVAGSVERPWSKPVEIRLDGVGPRVIVILNPLRPSHEIESGQDLEVLVQPDLNVRDLSGIKTVEVAFDSASGGDAAEPGPKWEVAKAGGEGWTVKLPTTELALGSQTVLIRATDNVGNQADIVREDLEILKKPSEQKPAALLSTPKPTNSVAGRVHYGNEPVDGAKVSLDAPGGQALAPVETDDEGLFRFTNVPPGQYTIRAEGMARNRMRRGEAAITVQPRPRPPTQVTVELRQ